MKIYKGTSGHCGDTFRELVDMWKEMGLCEVEETSDDFCWAEEKGKILLYDFPRLDDRQIPSFEYGLFGNTVPDHPQCSKWIMWARSPRKLEKRIEQGLPSYSERNTLSIFLGKVENYVQQAGRTTQDWEKSVEEFSMPIQLGDASNTNYKYTQEEYLDKVAHSKFGLCLSGYGPKCNREIEYLGLGVVPIVTPGVDLTYHESLKEDCHYLRINTAEELNEKINSISKNQWKAMSEQGRTWYERNASPLGSFETTKKIIKEYSNGFGIK